jgi:hypothetical protein
VGFLLASEAPQPRGAGCRGPLRKSLRGPSPRRSPRKTGRGGSRGTLTCSIARPGSSRRPMPPTWRSSRSARIASAWRSSSPSPSSRSRRPAISSSQHDDDPVPDPLARAIGLNMLTGYTGLLSLGLGRRSWASAPMPATSSTTIFPAGQHPRLDRRLGLVSSAVGVFFGLPSLRIKGFYLAVATLAAQFFPGMVLRARALALQLQRLRRDRGADHTLFGLPVTGPNATPVTRYLVVLTIVCAMAWIASNIVHGRIGRMWMAVRDMDIAAELIGIRLLRAKLLAFAVSSFYRRRRRRDDGVPLARRGRARGVQHRPVVPAAVHDHHRRSWGRSSAPFSAPRSSISCRSRCAPCRRCSASTIGSRDDRAIDLHGHGR